MRWLLARWLLLPLLALACGGKPPAPPAEIASAGPSAGRSDARGTLQGQPFSGADALSYSGGGSLTVWVTSFGSACGLAAQNAGVKDGTVLVLDLSAGGAAPTQPGEYAVGAVAGARTVRAAALRTDPSCRAAPLATGAAIGTVTLANIGAGGASGTFDLQFSATGDRVSGAFEAASCPAAPLAARTPSATCR